MIAPAAIASAPCKRSPVPDGFHCWLRSTDPAGTATCHWCGATCDPILDLGDAPPARRRKREDATVPSGDLFEPATA